MVNLDTPFAQGDSLIREQLLDVIDECDIEADKEDALDGRIVLLEEGGFMDKNECLAAPWRTHNNSTIRGQVLHSYIPLLDRSIFIEKTSTMHLRFSFYFFTDFSDPFFVPPHLSTGLVFSPPATIYRHSSNLSCAIF